VTVRRRARAAGFTLIEVMIASAILIASIGLLLQLLGSGLDRLHRVGEHARLMLVEKEIHSRLNTINAAVQVEGQGVAAGWNYQWRARRLEPYRQVSADLGEAPFDRYVALYTVNVSIEWSGDDPVNMELLQLGWRATP
jgi:prepilin-type N-terminal cleavage/methylation domain-containing protein